MTNPLDMRGPEFLAFYLVYGLGVFFLAWLLRVLWNRASESPAGARWSPGIYPREEDAHAIALLRGGPEEVARTVLGRLVAEGFLIPDGSMLRLPAEPLQDRSRLPALEEEVLQTVTAASADGGIRAREALARGVEHLRPRLEPLGRELEGVGLIPGPEQKRGYRLLGLAAFLLVTGLGAAKLLVAISRGRSNVQFLILLLIVSVGVSIRLMRPPLRTAAGDRYLAWLKRSHEGLAIMLSDGRRQSFGELTLVAGIFGIGFLPMLASLQTALVPPPRQRSGGEGGYGGESGCGSGGGGSSCGGSSGCGGGGGCSGGGGCGGCGG
ncbi:MAG: TIGR04222 domain-containing membrane protein [Thermoanaerobaculia bacterium]